MGGERYVAEAVGIELAVIVADPVDRSAVEGILKRALAQSQERKHPENEEDRQQSEGEQLEYPTRVEIVPTKARATTKLDTVPMNRADLAPASATVADRDPCNVKCSVARAVRNCSLPGPGGGSGM